MNQQTRREASHKYLSEERLAEYHFRSLNVFFKRGTMDVVGEKATIETDIGDKEDEESVCVRLGDVRVEMPRVHEANGSEELLFPQEARLRSITYSASVFMGMSIVHGGEEKEEVVVDTAETKIGRMPIMVGSSKRNVAELSNEDLVEIGEDSVDPGGYFIVNGSERMLTTSEDLAPNKILIGYDMKHDDEIQVAKTFSQRRGYRTFALCERNHEGLLEVSFPSISGGVNFVTLVRVPGLESDRETVHRVSDDPEIVRFMLENPEEAEAQTQGQATETLGKHVAGGQGKNYQLEHANYVIDRYLLPHLHEEDTEEEEVRMDKAYYLYRMVEAYFELALQRRSSDSKDHYTNKRLKVSDDLVKDLFRTTLNKLARDVKYQLEHANMRNRDLAINTIARSDVLTERLERPITTGSWAGGRSGVSQLVDRTNYMSVLSHLRHLRSPLPQSQPHFEAYGLYTTQWGRICPSETSEGPNYGLVKNFTQAMEFSRNIEDEQSLKRGLASMGVEGIPGINSVDTASADD